MKGILAIAVAISGMVLCAMLGPVWGLFIGAAIGMLISITAFD